MERYRERSLEDASTRDGLGIARGLGRSRLPDQRGQRRRGRSGQEGAVFRRQPAGNLFRPAPLVRDRSGFQHRQDRVGNRAATRRPSDSEASKELLRVRDARHGRRAGLRPLRLPGDLVPRHGWQGLVEARLEALQGSQRLGNVGVASPPRGSALPGQRQRRALHADLRGQAQRQDHLGSRARRRQQLVHSVRLAERSANRDRDHRHRQGSLLRSGRQAVVGTGRNVLDRDSHALRRPRHALRRLGIRGRPEAPGIRDPARSRGRYQPQGRRDRKRLHRLAPTAGCTV